MSLCMQNSYIFKLYQAKMSNPDHKETEDDNRLTKDDNRVTEDDNRDRIQNQ